MSKMQMTGFLLRFDSLEEYSVLDDQQFGRLLRAGLKFAIEGTEPELPVPESYFWAGLRLKIVRDAERYKEKCEQNAKNIRKRWERQKATETSSPVYGGIRTNTNGTNNNNNNKDNNKSNIITIASGGNKQKQAFTPPTIEEVRQYCKERNNIIDPEQFVDYYQARDWYLKPNQRMTDWRASVRYWERNQRGGNHGLQRTRSADRVSGQRDLYEC